MNCFKLYYYDYIELFYRRVEANSCLDIYRL